MFSLSSFFSHTQHIIDHGYFFAWTDPRAHAGIRIFTHARFTNTFSDSPSLSLTQSLTLSFTDVLITCTDPPVHTRTHTHTHTNTHTHTHTHTQTQANTYTRTSTHNTTTHRMKQRCWQVWLPPNGLALLLFESSTCWSTQTSTDVFRSRMLMIQVSTERQVSSTKIIKFSATNTRSK